MWLGQPYTFSFYIQMSDTEIGVLLFLCRDVSYVSNYAAVSVIMQHSLGGHFLKRK